MIEIGFKSDKGIRRKNNEDAFFVIPEQNVYLVADGVGGNNAGEIASRTTADNIAEYVRNNPIHESYMEAELKDYFLICLNHVNKKIYELSQKHLENIGMATTIAIVYVAGNNAYVVNVGDSRVYLHRKGSLTQITEDHTYVNALIKRGAITKEQARFHEKRNVITRAIGGEKAIKPDFFRVEVRQNDIILLCTDGLCGEVDDEMICRILSRGESMSQTSTNLVGKANQCGGHDNITVICLKT